jgi:hypothetical protein
MKLRGYARVLGALLESATHPGADDVGIEVLP